MFWDAVRPLGLTVKSMIDAGEMESFSLQALFIGGTMASEMGLYIRSFSASLATQAGRKFGQTFYMR